MLQSFKLAIKSIWSNKMRSFLTMLGIIIGVAAVIILVSLVTAYMNYMTESFASMGTNRLTVNLINLPSRSLEVDQMYEFYDANTDAFECISPTVSMNASVKNGSDTMDATSVTGVSEDYLTIMDYELETGRNLQYADIKGRSKVCVIGAYVAQEIFGSTDKAYGETVKINGYGFKVVGVVAKNTTDAMESGDTNDFIWIPYSVAAKIGRANINSYVLTVREVSEASDDKTLLEDYLFTKFKNDDLYTVTAMSEMLDSLNSMISMVSLGLGGIAGISLLVAGVGVMNIMLVSVTERTREIGIRKALGARRSVILTQFVIEAAVTSSIGGVIGIVLGAMVTKLAGQLAGLDANPTFMSVLVSFSVSVGIGLFFGYMPASKASRLNPIDALRSE